MPVIKKLALSSSCLLALSTPCLALDAPPDDFAFFQKEASVVTAGRRPSTPSQSPATVYVVTSEDIRASGVQTLWDALRAVPGVDVMSERTSQGDVSIRGMNAPGNNRTLVLLDGKTVLNGFLDFTNWETIPVTLEEVDRIEVVEGPTSALYGGNAINGVINIITKSPEQLKGGVVSYTGGERNTHMGTALVGDRIGRQSYKLGLGWRSAGRFLDSNTEASSVGKAHGLYGLDLPHDIRWTVSGGIANHNVNIANGPSYDDGQTGFFRTDLKRGGTAARFFWNWGRTEFRDHPVLPLDLHYDTYDASLEQTLELPADNALTAGVSYRRNAASSALFAPGTRTQDLWALYFEDTWKPNEHLTFVLSGRGDHHPFTGWQFAPRGSMIYSPVPEHTFRLTAAEAFRNPTLFENYFDLVVSAPPFRFVFLPNTDLKPEKIQFFEVAHRGNFDRIKTSAAVFAYRLTNVVTGQAPPPSVTFPPLLITFNASQGNAGETTAVGGELGGEFLISREFSSFANYSYQSLTHQRSDQTTARSKPPKHKVNTGLRYKQAGWTGNIWAHWVDKTFWSGAPASTANPPMEKVRGYVMLNVSAGYRFSGRLDGLEVAASGFNLTDKHYETLPEPSNDWNGEIIASRWSGTVSYRFGL